MDTKKVLRNLKLKGESENGRFGIYMAKSQWKDLQAFCEKEKVSVSALISELVKETLESAKRDKK